MFNVLTFNALTFLKGEKMSDYMQAMQRIIHIAKTHHSVIESNTKDIGMHRSLHVMLRMLTHQEEPPTQKELAERLQISAAAVAVTLDKLESEGYVEKICSGDDRRLKCVKVTDKGRDALKKTDEVFKKVDSATFYGLSDDDISNLCGYLDVIRENLAKMKNDTQAGGDRE